MPCCAAFFLATPDVFAKKALKDIDEYVVAWGRLIWSALFILCLFSFAEVPVLTAKYWWILIMLLPVEITAIILYTKAIKLSPLSVTTPFLGLTPVFLIGTSFLILGGLLYSILYVKMVFREERIYERTAGGLLILAGIACIILW